MRGAYVLFVVLVLGAVACYVYLAATRPFAP